jgi:putative transposase
MGMPRIARGAVDAKYFHVLNRGNHRQMLFRQPEEFALCLQLLEQSVAKFAVELWGYCLMGNHWHLAVSVGEKDELSRWMHWLTNRHVRMMHARNARLGGGHVYQGRYKSFPIQDEAHLWTVLRYIEANPLRARLVKHAEDWRWSSLSIVPVFDGLVEVARPKLGRWPRDAQWCKAVNAPLEAARLDLLRRSVIRSAPYGLPNWAETFAIKTGLESTLRPRGRPRKLLLDE